MFLSRQLKSKAVCCVCVNAQLCLRAQVSHEMAYSPSNYIDHGWSCMTVNRTSQRRTSEDVSLPERKTKRETFEKCNKQRLVELVHSCKQVIHVMYHKHP